MEREGQRGHSLVELLVCVAIIGILMAMYLPALAKARRKAEEVAVKEGARQEYIGRLADTVNSIRGGPALPPSREPYRAAFRQQLATTNGTVLATILLCEIENESAFRAYWNTVINPDAEDPIEIRGGRLVARDPWGNEFLLKKLEPMERIGAPVPMGWEFLSTNLSETSAGTLGTNVMYTDGHVEYIRYPDGYPACPTVAELSHQFYVGMR